MSEPLRESDELRALAQTAVDRRYASLLSAATALRVDRQTLTRLVQNGFAPRLDVLERIALGLGEDVNAWRLAAGYDPIESTTTPREYFWKRFGELVEVARVAGVPDPPIPNFHGGLNALTHDQVDAAIETLREGLAREHPELRAALNGHEG